MASAKCSSRSPVPVKMNSYFLVCPNNNRKRRILVDGRLSWWRCPRLLFYISRLYTLVLKFHSPKIGNMRPLKIPHCFSIFPLCRIFRILKSVNDALKIFKLEISWKEKTIKRVDLLIWKLYFALSLLLILYKKVFSASKTDFEIFSKIRYFSI